MNRRSFLRIWAATTAMVVCPLAWGEDKTSYALAIRTPSTDPTDVTCMVRMRVLVTDPKSDRTWRQVVAIADDVDDATAERLMSAAHQSMARLTRLVHAGKM